MTIEGIARQRGVTEVDAALVQAGLAAARQ
jgi:hypothetical protein